MILTLEHRDAIPLLVPSTDPDAEDLSLAAAEARHISKVLALKDGRLGEAAKILGIHRNTLARKVRQYSLLSV